MKAREHSFSRDGITYDCFAIVRRAEERIPVRLRKQWFVTTGGREYAAMRYTGEEFATPTQRHVFEDAIVDLVRHATAPREARTTV